ncbi:three-Cys-motif partner protein TcmP [Pedobacter rhizosphaerae]|uniref:Three-Cys-motif partner protein n=1 Tax=Pedobacter rhizosphaerae TaxID=390241 RepID=A0A1H9SYE1_9SPHI|nr:three-Cys-motif partner protein TcmP [Pedobacter rhizosphaerae]SER89921.1 three-Cys-motif partner protein [Pedobacter rhizosphaerae]
MSEKTFFEEQTASSKIKANIVSKYFPSYCKIISKKYMPTSIRFTDLFAGPGIYRDGNLSTPILLARDCKEDAFLKDKVHFIFNDKEHTDTLKSNFYEYFPEGTFKNKPFFANRTVGEDTRVKDYLLKNTHVGKNNEHPTLLFIDPFGYKAIETKILAQFMKNWGNEIFLFVNIKRIHPALENDKFEDLMQNLFPTTLAQVRIDRRYKLNTAERISLIIDCLGKEYEKILNSKVYYTAFKFKEEDNDATSHYILHITKHFRGFDLVKQIYTDFANVGTIFDGINTYTFDSKVIKNEIIELFDTQSMNIDKLKDELLESYAGKQISAMALFDEHQKTNLYSRSHYSQALRKLVTEGRLKSTFTDNVSHQVAVLISNYCMLKFK